MAIKSARAPAAAPEELFLPAVAAWLRREFGAPTPIQAEGWPLIKAGHPALLAAPTGSGKTLAAFLAAIDDLVRRGLAGDLPDETRVVYVSPLKALSNDVERNLQLPLAGIKGELAAAGLDAGDIRVAVRTGDTPPSVRAAMVRRPPHILVTTPESLYVLLTSDSGRRTLATARTVIIDEIHALAGNRRGTHLALSLERLDALTASKPVRIGLSATQRPLETVGAFLTGAGPAPAIVDAGHLRELDLAIEVPGSPLESVMAAEVWEEVYDRLAELIRGHRTTLVFVNTRRLAERATLNLARRLGEDAVAAHHGSLSRERRLSAEARLKAGELQALVATASLELGIDIGAVDLVCQIGSTRSIATLLQRVGRSGHSLGVTPKGRLFPTSRDELVECAALLRSVAARQLDALVVPAGSADILAQQIIAEVACTDWDTGKLYELFQRSMPYRNLTRHDFDAVVRMVAEGFATQRGRRGALVHHDQVNGRLRGRRGARLTALTSGGAIPENADYDVILEPSGTFLGTLNEDFAVESMPGDVFQLGNSSWLIRRIEAGRVRVADAEGQPPSIPFWLGEAPSRTVELSEAVSNLRADLDRVLLSARSGGRAEATEWLTGIPGLGAAAAEQIAEYLGSARAALGALPTQDTLVVERFFDEAGNTQVVLHSPFGSRINRAWGLALRKRFCRRFNFELQAAATEDAIVLSLGPAHSFELAEVFAFLRAASVRGVLVQALLDAPMFTVRWRWNAGRALAVPRRRSGRKVAAPLQRMMAEDLIAVAFPDQLACLENIEGDREIPDHPLVRQTVDDCLHEAMDIVALEGLLAGIEAGDKRLIAVKLVEPSPLALEVVNARPYAFLDDAPLEERRTQAVRARRWLDSDAQESLAKLDPAAIAQVCDEAWPDVTTADELHDALVLLGFMTAEEGRRLGAEALFEELVTAGRAAVAGGNGFGPIWVAAERTLDLVAAAADARMRPSLQAPAAIAAPASRGEAVTALLRGRLEGLGLVTAPERGAPLGLAATDVAAALAALEHEGFVMRGRFRGEATDEEWCERRLLARINRYTIGRLRREIEPVTPAAFVRFLTRWQKVDPDARAAGAAGLAGLMAQLQGFEAPAGAWENEILPARLLDFRPDQLDALGFAGQLVWCRLRSTAGQPGASGTGEEAVPAGRRLTGPTRATPVAFLERGHLGPWRRVAGQSPIDVAGEAGQVLAALEGAGACFFSDLVSATSLPVTRVEAALGELAAAGRVTADGFLGLRALLAPSGRKSRPKGRRGYGLDVAGIEAAGRWSALGPPGEAGNSRAQTTLQREDDMEVVARDLIRRYGVVFRALLEREGPIAPWREIVRVYRRLEARGELRGGRFVAGFTGEQYAAVDAIGPLRAARSGSDNRLVVVSAADPLNLAGILTPDVRVPAVTGNRVAFRNGEVVGTRVAGEIHHSAAAGDDRDAVQAALRLPAPGRRRLHGVRAAAN